jgi:membrane-associated phospholipid phosphatase
MDRAETQELERNMMKQARHYDAFPKGVRVMAQVISILFHPLLMLLYAFLILAWSNPFLFGEISFQRVFTNKVNSLLFIWLTIFSFAVPMLTVFMMRGLNLVSDITLPMRTERIGPYIIVGLLYIIIFVNFNNNPTIPSELRIFSLGATIALFMAFFINLFSKISMHTVAMGGFLAMVLIAIARSYAHNEYVFILAVMACGLVGTARMILGAHEPADIYGGYFIGFLSQFVALNFLYVPPMSI